MDGIDTISIKDAAVKFQLEQISEEMIRAEQENQSLLKSVHPSQCVSALNLLHYLAMRSMDIRQLQNQLHERGLSTLAHAESHIRSQLLAILNYFDHSSAEKTCNLNTARSLLQQRSGILFGNRVDDSLPSIMVTLKTSHADDVLAVKKLLKAGMNIARINCAHDDEKAWVKMIRNVRETSSFTGISCKIYMDLAGPKIRTKIRGREGKLQVDEGDEILFTDDPELKDDLPVVGSTIIGIARQLKIGDRVLFDDGLIEAKVTGKRGSGAELEITRASGKKPGLKNDKGMNFPDSTLSLSALTDFDRQCLPFILANADMVGFSFIHNTPDLKELQQEMVSRKIPVILKIETPEGFNNLPQLLFTAMKEAVYGVMIARGDLAVEIGFEKLSEVQDELLGICQAAHAPVIWATQVLENLNKTGLATRAEITDASYGIMADCVMVNKGPHTVQVIKTLRKILESMAGYHFKKQYLFKPLAMARKFLRNEESALSSFGSGITDFHQEGKNIPYL